MTTSRKNPNVIIELNDSLIKDQTYIISINRNLIDEHKVKIKQEVQLAFSTGEKIDNGSIKGKVYHSSLASVGLWKINKINEDNFDIIIDDGLHEPEANLNLFHNSFFKLKKYGSYIIEDVPNKNLTYIQNELKNFEVEIVILRNKYKEYYGNNNLIVIKKNT